MATKLSKKTIKKLAKRGVKDVSAVVIKEGGGRRNGKLLKELVKGLRDLRKLL